jgi:hypothetical protein
MAKDDTKDVVELSVESAAGTLSLGLRRRLRSKGWSVSKSPMGLAIKEGSTGPERAAAVKEARQALTEIIKNATGDKVKWTKGTITGDVTTKYFNRKVSIVNLKQNGNAGIVKVVVS